MTTPTRNPASAKCCHAISFLGFIGALGLIGVMLLKPDDYATDLNCALAAGGILGAVFWWAIGDIVASVFRAAHRQ